MSARLDSLLDPQRLADVQAWDASLTQGVSAAEKAALLADVPPMPAWVRMSESERHATLRAMMTFGGGFVSRLATAWRWANSTEAARLGQAFDDLVIGYGPGSPNYAAQQRLDRFPAPADDDERTEEQRSADAAEESRALVRKELRAGLIGGAQ